LAQTNAALDSKAKGKEQGYTNVVGKEPISPIAPSQTSEASVFLLSGNPAFKFPNAIILM
jgi:hypothetical protein